MRLSFGINAAPPHYICTGLSYVIPEICCTASRAWFLFPSSSHNVPLSLLDDMPNNSSGRGCHGYGNRSDAPHLSLVTEERWIGTKVGESFFSQAGNACCTLATSAQVKKKGKIQTTLWSYRVKKNLPCLWLIYFSSKLFLFLSLFSPQITFSLFHPLLNIPASNQINTDNFIPQTRQLANQYPCRSTKTHTCKEAHTF